jgi:hypothetical protein
VVYVPVYAQTARGSNLVYNPFDVRDRSLALHADIESGSAAFWILHDACRAHAMQLVFTCAAL